MGLLSKTAGFLDRRFGWDRLPRPLGVLTLVGLRQTLRKLNLYDTGVSDAVAPTGADTRARTLDGSHNDLSQPTMGMVGQRFGRNVPVAITAPETLPGILEPNPRLVSRELLTRDEFIPATIVNVLAGAWLQFEVHDWLSHGQNEAENPWEVELAGDDPWYERPMQIARTRRDPSHRDDGTPPTFVTADSHWWDGSQIYGSDAAFAQAIADRVVLLGEERVQEREPEPEVPGDAGEIDLVVEVARELAVGIEAELAVGAGADGARERRVAAVDLRAVPPVRVARDVRGRRAVVAVARVAPGALDAHRPLLPRVVLRELELEGLLGDALPVAEPVVHLELEPRAGEDVHDRRRLELVAREQPATDEAWTRLEQPRQRLRMCPLERHVAAEAGADHPHRR